MISLLHSSQSKTQENLCKLLSFCLKIQTFDPNSESYKQLVNNLVIVHIHFLF